MLEGSGEREKGLPGASWAAGWRRRPLGSDGSWWKVEGGGIGRGQSQNRRSRLDRRAGQGRCYGGGAENGAGPAQEALTPKEDIPVGKRHGLNVITAAVECCQRVMVNQQETLVLSP